MQWGRLRFLILCLAGFAAGDVGGEHQRPARRPDAAATPASAPPPSPSPSRPRHCRCAGCTLPFFLRKATASGDRHNRLSSRVARCAACGVSVTAALSYHRWTTRRPSRSRPCCHPGLEDDPFKVLVDQHTLPSPRRSALPRLKEKMSTPTDGTTAKQYPGEEQEWQPRCGRPAREDEGELRLGRREPANAAHDPDDLDNTDPLDGDAHQRAAGDEGEGGERAS